MNKPSRTCKNCKFFREAQTSLDYTVCRRFPPMMGKIGSFPRVHGDMWCGEFKYTDEIYDRLLEEVLSNIGE